MARQDIAGLLTGISSTQQPIQQAVPGSPNFYGEFMAARGRGLQQGLGGLLRGGEPSPQEKIQGAMFELNSPTDKEGVAKTTQQQILDLTKLAQVQQVQGNPAAAAQTAAKVQQLRTAESLKAERSSLADFLELEYSDKGGKLRAAVMSGAINAGNIDKFIKEEEKDKITYKNITYTDDKGNTQTQMVGFNEQGKSFSETGQPIILPDDAQITITGRTEQDVSSGISEFTPKEFRAVRDDIISSRSKLKVLEGITDESIDTYLSFLGKGLAGTGKTLSSFSGLGGDFLNDFIKERTGLNLQEFAGEQGLLFGDLENYFNQKRHDITGAAAAISELKELRKGILSGETSPAVAKAKIAQIIQRERDSQEMNFTLLKQNGLDIKSYFDENATATPTYKEDVSNLTVSQQENKAVVDRILEAIKSERRD